MTQFKVQVVVSAIKLQWLREEYNKLFFSPANFDFDHDEKYTNDYESCEYSYSVGKRKREIEQIDQQIIEEIDDYIQNNYEDEENSEDDSEEETEGEREKREILEEFERFRKTREEYTEEAEKYENLYKNKMEIFLDSFPNFRMWDQHIEEDKYRVTLESFETRDDDENGENYEYVRNPFFLVVFLQKYIRQFGAAKPIKFKYFENADRAEKDAGVISVDYFEVLVTNLDDLIKQEK